MNIILETNIKISVLEVKDFEEDINIDLLNKLINSDLLQTEPWEAGGVKIENEKTQLLSIKKLIKNNKLKVSYKRPRYGFGRVYPHKSLSLCSLRRQIRHTLANGNYADIDVSNCHPEILYQMCRDVEDIPTKYLKYYVDNRTEILHETMTYYGCSKDEAKTLFIALMYYGSFKNWEFKTDREPTTFIYNFIQELKNISMKFIELNPDMLKIVKALQKKNEKGSVMSIILQEKERRILESIYNYLITKKIINNNDCVLCFDGIMIKKNKYSISLLEELSTVVEEELKFKLTFTEKALDQHYLEELKEIEYIKPSIFNNPEYLELKAQFELKCFRLENPFYFAVVNENDIQLFNNDKIINWSKKDYSLVIPDPEDNKKNQSFINVWLSDPTQKTYNKIVFDPSLKSINCYNYFNGFKYTDGETAPINNPFLNLLKRITNNDIKIYNYFVDWIAHIIQKPYQKTNSAIILYSDIKGVGKNCIVDGICKLLDGYSAHVETIEDITKNFNAHLVNKLFIYGDEIKASSKCISDKLKQVITRPNQNMEKKGKDAIDVKDLTNWLFTTNNRDAFKVEQGDRRLCLIECLEQKLSIELSTEYYKYIEDHEEMNKLFNYFKNHNIVYDIGKQEPPMTQMKKELEFDTKPAYIQMLYKQTNEIIDNRFTSQRLYEKSQSFATTNYLNHSYSITEFGTKIGDILKQFKKRTGSGHIYDINISLTAFNKILFEYDKDYYRYIHNLDENDTPTFTGNDPINQLDA